MSATSHSIAYGSKVVVYRIIRRDRRTLQISVLPDMSVEVVAPEAANDAAIKRKVTRRARWILRQIDYFRQFHPKTPARRYETGETHLYLGRRYRLKVVPAHSASVKLIAGRILVSTPEPDNPEAVRLLFEQWQKAQARAWFERRLSICLARFTDRDRIEPRALIVRQMKLRWGSMGPTGRISLNTLLIGAAVREIDYVITHELCHRLHFNHGSKFFDLLSKVLPDWVERKCALERRLA